MFSLRNKENYHRIIPVTPYLELWVNPISCHYQGGCSTSHAINYALLFLHLYLSLTMRNHSLDLGYIYTF